MLKITYFVHSTTTDNEQRILTGWAQGALSEHGIKQAKALAVKTNQKQFDLVFCSDLQRAVDSAHFAFSEKYEIVKDSRLREINYGDLNQHHENEFNQDKYWSIHNNFPNGESYQEVEARIADFLEYLKANFPNKHIAIVAHKVSQLAFDVLLNDSTWEQAIDDDWRLQKNWQPGWEYNVNIKA